MKNIDKSRWQVINSKPFLCTPSSKLRNFQFKFLHGKVATNTFLTKIGIKNDELCTFCRNETESLLHLFWSCPITTNFWSELKNWLLSQGLFAPTKTICVRLALGLNTEPEQTLIDFVTLLTRYYTYTCKMHEKLPVLSALTKYIKHYAILERQILNNKDYTNKRKHLLAFIG